MYKFLRKVHLWLSVPTGLVIALICATGCVLLFEPSHGGGAERSEFFLDTMRLHRWLFDVPAEKGMMTSGKMIVGISTVAMVLVLISGIAMWWMRSRHALGANLKINLHHGWHSFWQSLHTAGGIWVVVFLLTMALTGLTWSFGWYRAGFNSLFGIAKGSHVVYMVHSGAFGGIVTKILWLCAAAIGITLPFTGYYLWIRRLLRKRK